MLTLFQDFHFNKALNWRITKLSQIHNYTKTTFFSCRSIRLLICEHIYLYVCTEDEYFIHNLLVSSMNLASLSSHNPLCSYLNRYSQSTNHHLQWRHVHHSHLNVNDQVEETHWQFLFHMDWYELIHKYFFIMKKAGIMSSSDEMQPING